MSFRKTKKKTCRRIDKSDLDFITVGLYVTEQDYLTIVVRPIDWSRALRL